MRVFSLSPQQVMTDAIWRDIQPFFQRFAQKTGEATPEHVRQGGADSNLQVWGLQDDKRVHAVTVTEVSETAKAPVCTVRIAYGSAPRAMQEKLLDAMGAWAREIGCRKVRIVGRKGWLKRFPRFKQTAVVMEWDL